MTTISKLKGGCAAELPLGIDREADQPVYAQLAEILRQQILAGMFHPGEKLPSEAALVETFSVSPMTVRRAINLLAAQNIIYTAHGRGTFVKEVELGAAAFYLYDLKELFNNDKNTTVKLVEARFLFADDRIARKLNMKIGQRCIYIRRLLSVGDEPAFYHRGYLVYDPTRPVVEAEFQVTDLKGLLQGNGSPLIKSGELSLESAMLNQEEAAILKLEMPVSGMMLEHVFYDFSNKPVSWGWFVCASTHLRLHTWIGLEHANGTRDERTR